MSSVRGSLVSLQAPHYVRNKHAESCIRPKTQHCDSSMHALHRAFWDLHHRYELAYQRGEQELGKEPSAAHEPIFYRAEVAMGIQIDALVSSPSCSSEAAQKMQQLGEQQAPFHTGARW